MAATIVRPGGSAELRADDGRLVELVRDLTGVPRDTAVAAFRDGPPAPAEPLRRVAYALVALRHLGHPGIGVAQHRPTPLPRRRADQLPEVAPPATPIPLVAGPPWPQHHASRLINALRTASSTQPTGSPSARSRP
jgi:hypothetical protein